MYSRIAFGKAVKVLKISAFMATFFVFGLPRLANAVIFIPDNSAPILDFSSEGGYNNISGVDHNFSFLASLPTFKVVYNDEDDDSPVYIHLVLDGVPYLMTKDINQNGHYYDGEQYSFLTPANTYTAGPHHYHFETSDGEFTDRLPASGELGLEFKNDPVIIIPGIMGSEQKDGVWVIDPILHTYDNLIDTFKANGYTEDVDLFTFPYEWRDSNVDTAVLLEDKIVEVKEICNCDKVDLVAHSMGGLVARQYIQADNYNHDVDQLIFLGTPHLGAPGAYLTWEAGETGSDISSKLADFIFTREAEKTGYASIFDYVRHRPITSVEELLPTYDYLKDKNTNILHEYPNNYPRNIFLEELNNNVDKLYDSGVSLMNIVGNLGINSTLNIIRVVNSPFLPLWDYGFPDGHDAIFGDRGLEQGSGDGTVPILSGGYIDSNTQVLDSTHNGLPSNAEPMIISTFAGINQPILINNWHLLDFKILIIKILSPADIVVIAPDGKRVGKDFITGQEVNEVDGAFYTGFVTDNEYVTIPNPLDGEYHVQAQGTGNGGEYTIVAGYISGNTSASSDYVGQIAPEQIADLKVDVNSAMPEDIDVEPVEAVSFGITFTSPLAQEYQRPFILPIFITSTNVGSSIYSQSIWFDGKIVTSSMMDLFYLSLGDHILMATATNFIGTEAVATTSFKLVTSVSSTITDVERAFSLGWIAKKQVKDELEHDLARIIKIEKRIEMWEEKLPGKPKVIKRIERLEKVVDRILAKQLLRELDRYHERGWLNDVGKDLLTEDINWLINN